MLHPFAASHLATNHSLAAFGSTALRANEEIYAPGSKHNEDGTMIRYSPALENRFKAERLQRKQEVGLMVVEELMVWVGVTVTVRGRVTVMTDEM